MRRPAPRRWILFLTNAAWLSAGIAGLAGGAAHAAEITDVASAFDEDNAFDFRLRVGYWHTEKRAAVKRELEQAGQDAIPVFKDLLFAQHRDTLNLRTEISIFHDLMFTAELPIVIGDSRELRYDQALGSGCIFPGDPSGQPNTCVNAQNSTTTGPIDGSLSNRNPSNYIVPPGGYDATTGGGQFIASSDMVFQGPHRGGGADAFDTLNLGLTWAVLAQKRDDTKPTWTISLEGQISVAPTVMKFDRMHPDANHSISEGVHRLIARTAVSHRFKYIDPYAGFWYMAPFARGDSLYTDYGPAQKIKDPQQAAGTVFGIEGIPWERPEQQYKISIRAQARIEARFDGRGYSEIWEMLASSPALSCDPMWNPACDPNQVKNAYQGVPYSGLTTIENYATIGGDLGLFVQAGKYVRFHAGFEYAHDQSHFVTIDDVGRSFVPDSGGGCSATPSSGRVSKPCEFNPAYRAVINQVGRRYKIDNTNLYHVGLWGQIMF